MAFGYAALWDTHLMTDVVPQHIEIVQGAGGPKARVAGSRIRVQDIAIWHEKLGLSPDEIVERYPQLTMADVHAALAYYWDHRAELEHAIAADEQLLAELRRQPSLLQQRLEHLRDGEPALPA
jgi:uncharacterized protein (DUF433 family)